MSKKTSKKSKNQIENKKVHLKKEFIAILVITLTILMAISLYISKSGIIMIFIKNMFLFFFGTSAYLIPLIILIYSFYMLSDNKERFLYEHIGPMLLIITIISTYIFNGIQSIIEVNKTLQGVTYIVKNKSIYINMSEGIFGRAFGQILLSLFNVFGSYVILISMSIIVFMLLTKKSFIKILRNMFDATYKVSNKVAKGVKTSIENNKKNINSKQEDINSLIYDLPPLNGKAKMQNIIIDEDINNSDNNDKLEDINDIKIFDVDMTKEDVKEKEDINFEYEEEKVNSLSNNIDTTLKAKDKVENEINQKDIKDQEQKLESAKKIVRIPYKFPSIKLLNRNTNLSRGDSRKELLDNAKKLEETLASFGVKATVLQVNKGPTVTRYELQPSVGVKVSKIVNLADDIALNLAAVGVRIEAPIPGKAAIGIEVPNKTTLPVLFREVVDTEEFKNAKSKVSVAFGKDISGKTVVGDIAKFPHVLIAGATGSGKSVCINSIVASIIYKSDPNDVKLLMIDPKVVELKVYNGIPHLLIPVVTEPKKAASLLNWAVAEMLKRYKLFAESNVRDIKGYNALMEETKEAEKLPQIVIIIDELADLMMASPKEVEDSICRLAQMARAAGMNLIIATQRPSVDVITGVIKANIPSRIAFAVSSNTDSRTILDMGGAEKLLGKGDMLYYPTGASKPIRIQGAFISDKEVEKVVDFIKQDNNTEYSGDLIEEITTTSSNTVSSSEGSDELLGSAVDLILEKDKASISMFQRVFRIGYNRASRLMDELEEKGYVGMDEGTKPRKVMRERILKTQEEVG